MRTFVGEDRAGAVDYLLRWFDGVAAGNGPFFATLEAPMGMGKTRVVQELYQALAGTRQSGLPYWPRGLADGDGHVLIARKQIAPERVVAPGGAALPWMWWGVSCHVSHVGNPMQSLQTAAAQIDAHAAAIRSEVERKAERREDALLAVTAMLDLLGVIDPTAAVDAAQKGVALWRRRRERRSRNKAIHADRTVDPSERSMHLAVELAASIRDMAAAVPVVIIVDDAQWADPALVSLLRHLGEMSGARVLVVCCVWPEALAPRAGADDFSSWLTTFEVTHRDRLARFTLPPLPATELTQLVREVAPRTDDAIVSSIVDLASGNPLTLSLILDLDRVRRDIASDGSIDVDPAELAGLPRDAEALYQELWRQLPGASRRALAALALQGPGFTVGWLDEFAARIGQYDEVTNGFRHVLALRSWVRHADGETSEFAEVARYRVALDNVQQVLSDEEQAVAQQLIAGHLRTLQHSTTWPSLRPDTRRRLLTQYLDVTERLPDDARHDSAALASAAVDLAELELDRDNAARAIELARTATRASDSQLARRARKVLGNALLAAGRGGEAVAVLEQASQVAPGDDDVTIDLDEAVEVAASQPEATEGNDADVDLEPYQEWQSRPVPSLITLNATAVAELIADVVRTEGPVLYSRVVDLLRTASGASRAGAAIRNALDRGLAAAATEGLVTVSAPDASGDPGRRTLTTPGQTTGVRQLGPRSTWQVPPVEIEAFARSIAKRQLDSTRDGIKRELAARYGWARYTPPLDALLEMVIPPDIRTAEAPAGGPPRDDKVRALAEEAGIADSYDKFVALADRCGLDTRRWPSSTTLTPKGKRQYTLVYVGVRSGWLHVGYNEDNLHRFLGIDPAVINGAVGPNWRDLTPADVDAYIAETEAILRSGETT